MQCVCLCVCVLVCLLEGPHEIVMTVVTLDSLRLLYVQPCCYTHMPTRSNTQLPWLGRYVVILSIKLCLQM